MQIVCEVAVEFLIRFSIVHHVLERKNHDIDAAAVFGERQHSFEPFQRFYSRGKQRTLSGGCRLLKACKTRPIKRQKPRRETSAFGDRLASGLGRLREQSSPRRTVFEIVLCFLNLEDHAGATVSHRQTEQKMMDRIMAYLMVPFCIP